MDYSNIDLDELTYAKYFTFLENENNFFGRNPVNHDNLNNRPQLHTNDEFILNKSAFDEVLLKEDKQTKEKKVKKDTIMETNLGTIISNVTDVIINFWPNYKKSLVIVKTEMDDNSIDDKDKNISYILNIHIQALVHYIKEDNNVLYIGIIFIILSILLYFINVIR
jgi:hypothetical protein